MEKLIRFSPLGMLCIYLIKCLALGPNPVDAAILAVLAGLYGYSQFKTDEKAIAELKTSVLLLKTEQEASKKRDEEVRSHISSMKLGMNMRTTSMSNATNLKTS